MNRSKKTILGAAAITVVCGCSGADRTARETFASQGQALQVAQVALTPSTFPDAGHPVSTLQAGAQNAGAAKLALGDPNEKAQLRAIALVSASRAGVSSPKTMLAVGASDHQTAAYVLSGAILQDHAPVYVVKMSGGPFTATQHPPGVAAPQGQFLTITVDAATHRVTDIGYDDVEPDLSQIDAVTTDLSTP